MSRFLVVATMSHESNTVDTLGIACPGTRADAEQIAYENFMRNGQSPVTMYSLKVDAFPAETLVINGMC